MTQKDFRELVKNFGLQVALRDVIANTETDELILLNDYEEMIHEQLDLGNYDGVADMSKALADCGVNYGKRSTVLRYDGWGKDKLIVVKDYADVADLFD